jgi:drug/metabolite transporter (DMT)-like permease
MTSSTDVPEVGGTAEAPTHKYALLAVFIAVLSWGVGPVIVRGISAPFLAFTPVRMAISVPLLYTVCRLSGGRITRDVWRVSLIPGVIFSISIICAFASFKETSLANATLIASLNPVLMLFVAPWLLKERVDATKVVLCLVALAGVGTVVIYGQSTTGQSLRGDVLAIVNLFAWTAYSVFVKKVRTANVHPSAFLTVTTSISVIILMPVALISGADFTQINGNDWWLILAQCVIAGLLGMLLIAWATRFLDATLVALMNLISPVISSLFAWFLYDQALVGMQILGACVMLVAVGIVVARR